ncbi:hypothetical protein GCM10009819_10130 [Agromyces tropicus]|uniref:DUF7882 domain-containing protein n=1 Tax=Agromyces tropicus TaxID=555371 RepID=A0ABN2U4W0_9MICO
MGTLHLGRIVRIDLPDEVLVHVHVVVIAKLRVHEPVLVGWTSPEGTHDEVLVHPSMPVAVTFDDERDLRLDRRRVDLLMRSANGVGGLQLTPELLGALAELDRGSPEPGSAAPAG